MCQLESVIWTSQLFGNTGVMLWAQVGKWNSPEFVALAPISWFFFFLPLSLEVLMSPTTIPAPSPSCSSAWGRRHGSPALGTMKFTAKRSLKDPRTVASGFKGIKSLGVGGMFFNKNNICWGVIVYTFLTYVFSCFILKITLWVRNHIATFTRGNLETVGG